MILFRALVRRAPGDRDERGRAGRARRRSAVRNPGPNAQIVLGEEILPLVGVPEGPSCPSGSSCCGSATAASRSPMPRSEVLDIATLSGVLKRVNGQPTVVGVTLVDGETAELVDCHALFASQAAQSAGTRSLTCRLTGEDGWMRNFLGPIIEAAGYRIVDGDEPADIAFVDRRRARTTPSATRARRSACAARRAAPAAPTASTATTAPA